MLCRLSIFMATYFDGLWNKIYLDYQGANLLFLGKMIICKEAFYAR